MQIAILYAIFNCAFFVHDVRDIAFFECSDLTDSARKPIVSHAKWSDGELSNWEIL